MSPLSRRELLILYLDSNFNSNFLFKHYRICFLSAIFQLIPPFPRQIFFILFNSFFWAI